MTFGSYQASQRPPDRDDRGHRRRDITLGYRLKVAGQLCLIFLALRMVMLISGLAFVYIPVIDPQLRMIFSHVERIIERYQ